ncbi:ANKYRIN REPEAT PROTEIN [Salix koriyanagi]|uniref:ANKYRIN REPEAT PROTEIN n=1 Tax=Salix koriyanagi TaxID=2511006 RepID=A0A9Q0UZ65_9ROSI|nr:ANKYRIN REPEAT PROTEIN [Salix koriyanagi]
MAGREVREYTNLTDPKDKKSAGKGGRDKVIDDEDITFHRMVAKMQEVAGERGGYLHGRGALDSDDLLYLKEQMEAEEDAERLLRRTEKRAFAAFKKAASLADSSPASVPLSLRVEPKPKSGIRQQDLLKKVVEVKPKRLKASNSSDGKYSTLISSDRASDDKTKFEVNQEKKENILPAPSKPEGKTNVEHSVKNEVKENPVKSLLGLAYASSDEEED